MRSLATIPAVLALIAGGAAVHPPGPVVTADHERAQTRPADPAIDALVAEAAALRPLVQSAAALEMLDAVAVLPSVEPTSVYYRPGGGSMSPAFTQAAYDALPEPEREGARELEVDTERYYSTFYGSPLAALRAFDLAAQHGVASFDGKRVLDFGFGSVGQLHLLAACGAEAVGAEVMPLLEAIYGDGAAHASVSGPGGRSGSVRMLFGRWPAESHIAAAAGGGFDLFISKNTIKRGYVNPPVETDPQQRLDFGVDTATFLRRLHEALAPGGLVVIYNLGGKPAAEGEPYIPMTDIASPWPRDTYRAHGFDVLVLDGDDSEMARRFGAALGWNEGENAMDLEQELFAKFTVLRRR
jgi:hypothetical protein